MQFGLSTLHTNDAPSTITRMVDMEVDRFMVASATILVSAQRLARPLCKECRKPVDVSRDALLELGLNEEDLGEDYQVYEAVGCTRCVGGYRGRFALLETMPMTETIKRTVIEGGSAMVVKAKALEENMLTLRRCGMLNALRGKTSIEEVLQITMAD